MKTHTLRFLLGVTFFALICSVSAQDPNLIDVDNLEQLNAIRYDLDGDGVANETTNAEAYEAVFGTPSCPDGCEGYELTADLDFNDIDAMEAGEQLSRWSENCSGSCETGTQADGTAGNTGWEPIGDNSTSGVASRFTATFNGNDYRIRNLYINRRSNEGI